SPESRGARPGGARACAGPERNQHQWNRRKRVAAAAGPSADLRKGEGIMNLRQRLGKHPGGATPTPATSMLTVRPTNGEPDRYQILKKQLHREMISKLDLNMLESLDEAERRSQVERVARRLLAES